MLSVLKNAIKGSTTYYVGDDITHINHLSNCTLICKHRFEGLDNVEQIIVDNPQLHFYRLSHKIDNEYTFNGKYFKNGNVDIHPSAVIGDGVILESGVSVGPNTVIYSKTHIGENTRIDANCSIGTEGMMWVWDDDEKVFLKQLGGVKIGKNCVIGSNSAIVRGSANEDTMIEDGVNIAPGCNIGHGTFIGKDTHFANNIATGGSTYIESNNFIGCGVSFKPGTKISAENVIIGTGAVIINDITEHGVYVGTPAKKIKEVGGKMSGVPIWKNKIAFKYNPFTYKESFKHVIENLRKHYPISDVFIYLDDNRDDIPYYQSIADQHNCNIILRPNHRLYLKQSDPFEINYPKMIESLERIYHSCKNTTAKWIMHLEDDVLIKRKIREWPKSDVGRNRTHAGFTGGGSVFDRKKFIQIYESLGKEGIDDILHNNKGSIWAGDIILQKMYSKFHYTSEKWVELAEPGYFENKDHAVFHGFKDLHKLG